jgi:hypothetical protein
VIESDSPLLQFRLHDSNGRVRGAAYNEDLIASNVHEFIPYIPASTYEVLSDRVILRVMDELTDSAQYILETTASIAGNHHLTVRLIQDGATLASQEQVLTLASNTSQSMRISLANNSGTLGLNLDAPHESAWLEASPGIVSAVISPRATTEVPFQLTEVSGHTLANTVNIQVSDLISPSGRHIPSTSITPITTTTTIPPGGSQVIRLSVASTAAEPNIYRGGITITLSDGTRQLIPMQLEVTSSSSLYLPLIIRS